MSYLHGFECFLDYSFPILRLRLICIPSKQIFLVICLFRTLSNINDGVFAKNVIGIQLFPIGARKPILDV